MPPPAELGDPAGTARFATRPVPVRARVRCGGRVLAESSAAVRVEVPEEPPTLWFPPADVRLDRPGERRTASDPVMGTVDVGDLDGEPGLYRTLRAPPAELAALTGFVTFDPQRADVELVDGAEGDDPRGVTVKRFPTWGDAADLVDLLDVRPVGDGRYTTVTRPSHQRAVVEGSQMLGQAIVAAGRLAPDRRVVSAHLLFLRAADVAVPLDIRLDAVSAGRTFTGLAAAVDQSGRRCATGVLLCDTTAPDTIRHTVEPPAVPGPYDSEPVDMSVTGRDIRVVDGAYDDDPDAPVGPPVLDAWVRFRHLPEDPFLHAGLMAQFTGHLSIAAALRPHAGISQRQAHRSLSTAINAIGLSIHGDVRADRWMLYDHHSTFAGDGMTHSECRVHGEDGQLVASFTVDAMVRGFVGGAPAADERRAL